MIRPERLQKGDKVAIVSLSAGTLGEPKFIHKYYIAKERLEKDFGLEVVTMPNALKGKEWIYNNPKARARIGTTITFVCSNIKCILYK